MPPAELAATLEHRSGLLGLAGTADLRAILDRADADDPEATVAVEVYVHRLRGSIAAMAAAMDGLDVLVFTGGVGENAPRIRALACAGLGFLGVELDEEPGRDRPPGPADEPPAADREIGRPGAPVRVLVIGAREDLEIAHEVRSVLGV
jgi:acetate kinase